MCTIGASEIICKWIPIEFFLKNYLLRKGKILIFWKWNEMKGGNKDA